jgi:RNA polymerase sigma-70 factor (ECF subfamily)
MTGSERRDAIEIGHEARDTRPPEPAEADRITIARAQRGDMQAYEQLYRVHVARVHALCLRLGGDATRAEDLVQEVFLRAWERIGTFEGRSSFATWLYRLAMNRVTDLLRSEIRRSVHHADAERVAEVPQRQVAPDARIDLESAIRALPPGARFVFVMHDVEGRSHEEIAAAAGIAVGTSKSQLYRARRLLREMLVR